MEARSIPELEDAARRYAAIRDKRMALNDAEVKLQDLLMGLLKKHGKREYKHDGVQIWIQAKEEKARVRISDEDDPPSSRKEEHAVRNDADVGGASSQGRGRSRKGQGVKAEGDRPAGESGKEAGTSEGEAAKASSVIDF